MGRPDESTEYDSSTRAFGTRAAKAGDLDEPTHPDSAALEPTEAATRPDALEPTEAATGAGGTVAAGQPPTRPIEPGAITERSTLSASRGEAGGFSGTARFSIVREIGRGGMGVVFEAHDRVLDDRVALKTIQHLDPSAIYRFKKEFRSLADITHPNLVRLYELIAEGDLWLLSMELIDDGVDFRSYLRGGRPEPAAAPIEATAIVPDPAAIPGPAEETVASAEVGPDRAGEPGMAGPVAADGARLRATFRQLAQGVKALHDAGKLHRDLKPGNVLVRPDGRVVLLDFGLVAELDGEAAAPGPVGASPDDAQGGRSYQSTDRQIAGTAAYMSPEQAGGRPLTQASDWYAVGVMLYHALTGRLPIEGRGRGSSPASRRSMPRAHRKWPTTSPATSTSSAPTCSAATPRPAPPAPRSWPAWPSAPVPTPRPRTTPTSGRAATSSWAGSGSWRPSARRSSGPSPGGRWCATSRGGRGSARAR